MNFKEDARSLCNLSTLAVGTESTVVYFLFWGSNVIKPEKSIHKKYKKKQKMEKA